MVKISSFIQIFNTLKHVPIFSKLGWIDLQKIARKSILSSYRKGDIIRKAGDPPDFFYCLISGRLQAYTINSKGDKDNVDFIHRGVYFGIISLLTGENHSMNFEALNDSIILKIAAADFQRLLKSFPQLGIEFSHALSKRMRRKVKGRAAFESSIISIYSSSRGSGSSTYAVNLALSLKEETDKKIILVSIHPQDEKRDKTQPINESGLQWHIPGIELSRLAENPERIQKEIIECSTGIDLIKVSFDPTDDTSRDKIVPFASNLIGDYHYVIVNLPNEMDDVVLQTLTQSDWVHLITRVNTNHLDLVRRVIDRLEKNLKENFKEEKIKVIVRSEKDRSFVSFEEINRYIDYHVYAMLPTIEHTKFEKETHLKELSFLNCKKRSNYNRVVTRIAREIGGVLVGLALGGGAALGLSHIGVLRVLEKEDIPVDIIVGSSMGALIGSLWVTGRNSEDLAHIAQEFKSKLSILKLIDWFVLPISGFVSGYAIKRWLKKYLGNRTFYSTRVPLKIVAYDLAKREEIVINGGSILEAVRKSISIPGLIKPILQEDQIIIDGGVMNPLPTSVLAANGIKKIISVNVLQSPEDIAKSFEISKKHILAKAAVPFHKAPIKYVTFRINRIFSKIFRPNIADIIVFTLQAAEYVIAEQSSEQADINIHPEAAEINWHELYKVEELIKAGEDATRKVLPEIKNLIKR